MDSFIFDSFKQNLIDGKFDGTTATWQAYPVNKSFVDDMEETLKYIKHTYDIPLFQSADKNPDTYEKNIFKRDLPSKYVTNMVSFDYTYRTMYETDQPVQPLFVKGIDHLYSLIEIGTISQNEKHLAEMFFNPNSKFYRNGKGFYYVKTSEELLWCANKVNGAQYDNTINIVLGDNIGIVYDDLNIDTIDSEVGGINNREKLKKINYSIGSNPAQPFEGIFFGNGFSFINIELICSSDVCGIFGYLGYNGIISSARITGFNIITCNKRINIDHLVTYGTDVHAGLLCGKNNGTITNVCIDGTVVFNDFVPKIYSVNNKSESTSDVSKDIYDYYPDYYCFDSPGNIIPYIGYFNEGVFATWSGYDTSKRQYIRYWNTDITNRTVRYDGETIVSPKEWHYWVAPHSDIIGNVMHFTHPQDRINILWYDGKIVTSTNVAAGGRSLAIHDFGLFGCKTLGDQEVFDDGNFMATMKNVPYLNKSIKLSQQNRLAYYVSPLIGVNNSEVENTYVNTQLYTSGTFVGFIGGVAGKQTNGVLNNVRSSVSAYDIIDYEHTDSQSFYKRNIYKAQQNLTDLYNKASVDTVQFNFIEKSIKNISSLFGSCIIGDINSLRMSAVDSYLDNYHNIVFRNGNISEPEYDDYYFLNRFGSLAAVVEYNSSNIGDMWFNNTDLNDVTKRSILAHGCTFGYKEHETSIKTFKAYNGEDITLQSPHKVVGDKKFKPGNENNMYGVASPLIAELKPTFKSVPSVISTFFKNRGAYVTDCETDENTKFYHVGLFGIDQNIASPYTDNRFQCINLEVDLPGVANGNVDDSYYYGAAGGVVDRLNCTSGKNFAIDIRSLPSKIINWDNTESYIVNNNNMHKKPFSKTRVPEAAKIAYTRYAQPDDIIEQNGRVLDSEVLKNPSEVPDGVYASNSDSIFSYCANKIVNNFAYFGSNIAIISEYSKKPGYTDIGRTNGKIIFQLINPAYWGYDNYGMKKQWDSTGEEGHHLGQGLSAIKISIDGRAFDYKPFTDKPITKQQLNEFYGISAYNSEDNGCNLDPGHENYWYKALTYDDGTDPDDDTKCIFYNLEKAFPGSQDKLRSWFGKSNLSGFSFYVDRTKPDEVHTLHFLVPFNITEYAATNTEPSPPYQKFEGIFFECTANEKTNLPMDYRRVAGGQIDRHLYLAVDSKYTMEIKDATQNTVVQPWYGTNYKGSFINALLTATDPGEELIQPTGKEFNFGTITDILYANYDGSITAEIKENINLSENSDKESNPSNFRYTYDKSDPHVMYFPLTFKTEYNAANGKHGFWYHADKTSGAFEFNKKLNYYGNIFAIGKELSQDALMTKCLLTEEHSWTVSGFSADDFQGLYIQDDKQNPIMYIDVGLGECLDGTCWSLSSYPSVNVSAEQERLDKLVEEGKITKQAATDTLTTELDNCSGLFLEIKLDAK